MFTELTINTGTQNINTATLVSPSTGTYLVTWRVQLGNAENNVAHRARVWLEENGSNLPRSATTISIPGAHGGDDGFGVLSANFIYNSNAGDTYRLMWSADDLDVTLETTPAGTTPVYPLAPAVVLTAYKLAGGYG